MAADFIPVSGVSVEELTKYAALSSLSDATPEGKSVVALAKERGVMVDESSLKGAEFIEFTGPIKSLNSINRRLTHHITLHTHCRLTVLEHSLELSWYVRADKGSNKIG